MRICIIYFSPAGSTRKVANALHDAFLAQNCTVQLLDMTKAPTLFPEASYADFFQQVEPHDLLLVGGPVYIDHMQYNLLDLLAQLPHADSEKWGKYAGVFCSFGKIAAGVALTEAAKILFDKARTTIVGLEVDSSHCIARNLPTKISPGLPDKEIVPLIREAVESSLKIISDKDSLPQDLTQSFQKAYQLYPQLKDEQAVVAVSYPKVAFAYDLCLQCMACVESCPVNYLVEENGYPNVSAIDNCIHCTNCLYNCPTGAILMDLTEKETFLQAKLQAEKLTPAGPSISKLYLG